MLILFIKSIFFIILAILFRSSLPRYRIDQLLVLNWKIFIYFLIFLYIFLIILFLSFF